MTETDRPRLPKDASYTLEHTIEVEARDGTRYRYRYEHRADDEWDRVVTRYDPEADVWTEEEIVRLRDVTYFERENH